MREDHSALRVSSNQRSRDHLRPQATLSPFWEKAGYRDFDCTITIECYCSTSFESGMLTFVKYNLHCIIQRVDMQFAFSESLLYAAGLTSVEMD